MVPAYLLGSDGGADERGHFDGGVVVLFGFGPLIAGFPGDGFHEHVGHIGMTGVVSTEPSA